jgi:hypothetical protein
MSPQNILCREIENKLIDAAVTVGGKSGTALARKIKITIENSAAPEATAKMRKTGAIRTALYRY